ncbi:MAG: protein kinase [Lachnospiraceae bacterium]|nr:protein kinase [Lachnospiraceae bacterium]
MLKPGIMLGDRYEIIELVGSGGMSEVYKAKDHKLNRHVAVKVLKNEFSDDRNFVSKFRVEAQSAAGLAHPNIVNVYDVGEDDGIYYIVMEYVEGITLKDYIYNKGRLSVEEALDFSLQIASGIEMAHQNHTIHRDIKPQNIIVSKNGTLKVTDFGIARAATSNTVASSAMGSVHYISPEQARGGYSDEKSDIYSLGITMYEMVTGHVPFEGDNNITVALMHIQGEMIPPRQYYPDIPAAFEKVILKCTQKKPERRYLTASALIADLHRVATNPNGDFVVLSENASNNAQTVSMSQEELNTIREATAQKSLNTVTESRKVYEQEAASQESMNMSTGSTYDSDPDTYEEGPDEDFDPNDEDYRVDADYDDPADAASDNYENNGYNGYNGYENSYGSEEPYPYDMKDEDEDIDPKLKRIVMIGGIVAAVLIAMIVMLIVGKISGWKLTPSSKPTDAPSATEDTQDKSIEMTLDVVGMKIEDAESALTNAGIPYVVDHENSDSIASGLVISQSFDKGDKIPEGSSVRIIASSGKEEVPVPNVVGYEVSQAETLLAEAGLQVTHAYEYSDEVEKDHIVSQEPDSTQTVSKDTKVKIVVSNGKEIKDVEVPDLRGKTKAEAEATLQNVKLKLGNVSEEYSEDVEEGRVIAQSTSVGTKLAEESSIDITISKGPEATTTEATTTEATTTETTTEAPKTYSATFSGSISVPDDYEGELNIQVQYVVSGSTQVVVSGTAKAGTPYTIPADTKLTGLSANNGQIQVTYNGSVNKPDGVQQSVNVQVAEE